jgi:hypothetical protein
MSCCHGSLNMPCVCAAVQTGFLCSHLLQDPPSSYNRLRQQQQQQQQQQDSQQQQQGRCQVSRAWPRPEQDVCKAISLRLKRADSTTDVLAVIAEHSQRFNEVREIHRCCRISAPPPLAAVAVSMLLDAVGRSLVLYALYEHGAALLFWADLLKRSQLPYILSHHHVFTFRG